MLIKRIKAINFKTYLNLDEDISVEEDKPIILIGGVNGGGKTTFFEAIYGALYGLKIYNAEQFKQLLNAGATEQEEKIMLELHFSGKVVNDVQQYVITRTYILNPAGLPVESVKLNMNGSIFSYGTATPSAQRVVQEAEVNKIIKANLPQELSRYFLFDAMEAGNLLKEDQLNRVIKENIENVMGFNKYMLLAKGAETLYQQYTAERLQVQNEKEQYLELVAQKNTQDEVIQNLQTTMQDALIYSVTYKQLSDSLKSGLNQESTIKSKIVEIEGQIANIYNRESNYHNALVDFAKEMEINVCVPKLAEALKSEITLILKNRGERLQQQNSNISSTQIEAISTIILQYLNKRSIVLKDITLTDLIDYIIATSNNTAQNNPYAFLDYSEETALENLLNIKSNNSFPALNQQQVELNISLGQVPAFENQKEILKSEITGKDYALLNAYQNNESIIKSTETAIVEAKEAADKIDKKLHQFDIQTSQDPDPKYEALSKLKSFFEDVANQLLKVKKQQIELRMKQDLNINLGAYQGVIDRVVLSEDLRDLTFKIYHTAGNEIYLNHLNAASKQVVIQVLLKSLHEYGDYDPPVMIDTVMGVLDEASRATVLENYFPSLSHQTILLSSDSEIRIGKDLHKILPFISKTFTLQRNKEKQLTEIVPGYFGENINE